VLSFDASLWFGRDICPLRAAAVSKLGSNLKNQFKAYSVRNIEAFSEISIANSQRLRMHCHSDTKNLSVSLSFSLGRKKCRLFSEFGLLAINANVLEIWMALANHRHYAARQVNRNGNIYVLRFIEVRNLSNEISVRLRMDLVWIIRLATHLSDRARNSRVMTLRRSRGDKCVISEGCRYKSQLPINADTVTVAKDRS